MNTPNERQAIIQVKNVVKNFRVGDGEVTILKDISFEVQEGEFVSIVGPSGNGKSTLLNMITGIDRPSAVCVVPNSTVRETHNSHRRGVTGIRDRV